MMGDKLEDFIRSNREEFDFSEPGEGHLKRFEAKRSLVERKAPINWRNLLKVAAVIVFVLGSGILLVHDNSTQSYASEGLDLRELSPELAEVETFYEDQIENATEELAPIKKLDQRGFNKDLAQQLTLLEEEYNELKLEMRDNYGDERLINAMIKNYQLRLQIIEQYLNQIKLNTP